MTKVVFPGSFDPVTVGHLSIIERASRLFSEVHIAISENPSSSKTPMWSLAARKQFMQSTVKHLANVKIHSFDGLLVDYLKKIQIPVIVRGVRSALDWNFESELFQVHKILWPEVEMVCLRSDAQYDVVSSTYVREIRRYGGDIKALVPPSVYDLIQHES
jgi:pantetheine-phosphate adenylyltransferase